MNPMKLVDLNQAADYLKQFKKLYSKGKEYKIVLDAVDEFLADVAFKNRAKCPSKESVKSMRLGRTK